MAENLYKYIIARCKEHIDIVEQGEFGAGEKGRVLRGKRERAAISAVLWISAIIPGCGVFCTKIERSTSCSG